MRLIDIFATGFNGIFVATHLYRFATYGSVDAVYFGMAHAVLFGWCMAWTVMVMLARRYA